MKINLLVFLSSSSRNDLFKTMYKVFESEFRPIVGDIIDDPGFHPDYHNGYEVVKVTVNYALKECFVSLSPLAIEKEEISLESYLERLEANGWKELTRDAFIKVKRVHREEDE